MNILLIGGTGVVSSAIASRLVGPGRTVFILTDGNGALPPPLGVHRHLIADRNDLAGLKQAIEGAGVNSWDLVVDAVSYHEGHAQKLLQVVRGKARLIFVVSTTFVASLRTRLPLKCDSAVGTDQELGGYAANKLRVERVWTSAFQGDHIPVTIFRIPHVLARGGDLGCIPLHSRDPHLLKRLRNGGPLVLADGGRQVLQVIWGEDVGDLMLRAAERSVCIGKTYLCAHPEILTGQDYFEYVAESLGAKFEIRNVPAEAVWRAGWGWALSCAPRIYDLTSLQTDVGWLPSTPPRESIHRCVQWLLEKTSAASDNVPPDDFVPRISSALEGSEKQLTDELQHFAVKRIRPAIDLRMNIPPLPELK
jgi:nucleoside-diphosphate-sugar epimerase